MAIEQKRGCGFRKVGGLYLVGGGQSVECHRLPMNIHVCPVCSSGIKYSRGFTWIDPSKLFGQCDGKYNHEMHCHTIQCAVCFPPKGKHGLMWIGKKFYTPDNFTKEATMLGVSKRIAALPNNFVLGETWIYLAHLEAGQAADVPEESTEEQISAFPVKRVPAVFYMFRPQRIEKIITESQSKDPEEMKKLEKRGITPVIVPDQDKDHQGTVHDKEEE